MLLAFLLSSLISSLCSSLCYAHQPKSGKINAALGPLVLVSHGFSHAVDRSPLYGFALIVQGDVDQSGGIEISLMPMKKRYSIEREGQKTVESTTRAQIATGYRHWFRPWISAGLGFFSSYVMGEAAEVEETIGDRVQTSAADAVEYGFEASIQFEAFRTGKFATIFDARFAHSITPKGGEEGDHFGAIVGLKYEIQEEGQPVK